MPSPRQIAETVVQISGEIIGINGAEAALKLQLSTQVPMKPFFYTTGNTRRIKVGKLENTHVTEKIEKQLAPEDFQMVLKNAANMPA